MIGGRYLVEVWDRGTERVRLFPWVWLRSKGYVSSQTYIQAGFVVLEVDPEEWMELVGMWRDECREGLASS